MSKNREEFLHYILNHIQECIIRFDSGGRIAYCNDRLLKLTGYQRAELNGAYIGELFQKGTFALADGSIQLVKKNEDENAETVETVLYRKNNTCFPVELKVISAGFEEMEIFICEMTDITRYKESLRKKEEATLQMQEMMKARDSFMADIASDLRIPLKGIKGQTELLLEQETDVRKGDYLKMILDRCDALENTVNNILDFSKLESGKLKLEEKPFSFYGFMDRMGIVFTQSAAAKGLRFTMNVARNIPDRVIGDELRLTQILNSLVSNAVKFTAQGYVNIDVSLNAEVSDGLELFFMIVDTGIGLSAEDKDELYKRFSQVDDAVAWRYGGSGLGLSLAASLVNMMRGKVWADGERGKGSCFSFTIWLRQEAAGGREAAQGLYAVTRRFFDEPDLMYEFGSEQNIKGLKKYFEKLYISIDLENWQKAESFAAAVRQLAAGGSDALKRTIFRMEMTVRASAGASKEAVQKAEKQLMQELEGLVG